MPATVHGMQFQKEVKYNPKYSPAVKKCAALKKAIVKKDVKSKVVAKNGCVGMLMTNF